MTVGWFFGGMLAGQTFRISAQEQASTVLRAFMLLSVAGECPTTIELNKTLAFALGFCCLGCR